MSRLREGFRIVPMTARIVAAAVWVGLATIAMVVTTYDPTMKSWFWAQKALLVICVPVLPVVYVLLVGYVYADAKRRYMRYGVWTLLAAIVPYLIGVIIYFLMRDPLPTPCPKCGAVAPASFVFCPHCGTALKPSCPQCGKSVERDWANCAYCGRRLEQPTSHAA